MQNLFRCWLCHQKWSTFGLVPQHTHTQNWFPEEPEGLCTTLPRPWTNSSQREESKSGWSIFCVARFDLFFKITFQIMPKKHVDHADFDLPCQTLLFRCLRSFWGASVCWGIDFLSISGSQASMRALDNIVLTRNSDGLMRIHWFLV